jgi:hypothetical protein
VRGRFSLCGRCWVRTNVGDADGFTGRHPNTVPLGQIALRASPWNGKGSDTPGQPMPTDVTRTSSGGSRSGPAHQLLGQGTGSAGLRGRRPLPVVADALANPSGSAGRRRHPASCRLSHACQSSPSRRRHRPPGSLGQAALNGGSCLVEAIAPYHRAEGLTVRSWVVRSTAIRPNLGRYPCRHS